MKNTQQTINSFLDFLEEHENPIAKMNFDLSLDQSLKEEKIINSQNQTVAR